MSNSEFKVLLYSDGSHQAFSAAVYTATLLKKMPNMHLTIMQIQQRDDGSKGTEYSWLELRPKYKRYHWGCSTGTEYSWIDTWPACPTPGWMKGVLNESEWDMKNQYDKILTKTNEIFLARKLDVKHQLICSNIAISETLDISDTANTIIDYATKDSFELIIMGTRGLSTFKGLIYGSLAHNVLDRSPMPVLLIKKLPQDYIDSFLSDTDA